MLRTLTLRNTCSASSRQIPWVHAHGIKIGPRSYFVGLGMLSAILQNLRNTPQNALAILPGKIPVSACLHNSPHNIHNKCADKYQNPASWGIVWRWYAGLARERWLRTPLCRCAAQDAPSRLKRVSICTRSWFLDCWAGPRTAFHPDQRIPQSPTEPRIIERDLAFTDLLIRWCWSRL